MKILMLSKEGDGLGVAQKLVEQNNEVFVWVKEPRFKDAGRGIVTRVPEWRPYLGKADMVICDMVGFGKLEDTLRGLGKPTISCSVVMDMAELDREKGMQLFHACKIEIPETYSFPNPKGVEATLKTKEWDKGWVLKPDGNISTAKTLVVSGPEELPWALSIMPPGGSLIVQKVVSGIEVSTEGWFNGRDFMKPFTHTFEEKKYMNEGLGTTVGCMGNVVRAVDSNKLTKATVEKLAPVLSRIGYKGPVDVNCIVDKEHAYALEITARMGYDAIEAVIEGLKEPIADLFFETAMGTKKTIAITRQTMMAVRLSVPPWPNAKPDKECLGVPVRGITPENLKHLCLTDLYKEGKEYFTAAGDGVLLKATSEGGEGTDGSIVREAQKRVYRTLNGISVSGKAYRTDIGDRVDAQWKQLKEWGWINGTNGSASNSTTEKDKK